MKKNQWSTLRKQNSNTKSLCTNCDSRKSTFLKPMKPNKKQKQFSQITKASTFVIKPVKKHRSSTFPKILVLILKNEIKGKAKCAICLTERTFIDEIEIEYDLQNEQKFIFSFLLTDVRKKKETFCVTCGKKPENLNSKIFKTNNGRLIVLSKCTD